ncbi:excalibur calcium-binding domain-containing protein [Corynebacterium sanguinis]|nr:excalibur calcium-binding domain-containing protein [Corynebacterium sanguinis]MCT1445376.1 excalibur calcium-binding domain-containing protein [Corynebacterium sanguinis]
MSTSVIATGVSSNPVRKPYLFSQILAWAAFVLGLLSVVGGIGAWSFRDFLTGLFFGLALLIPSVWWFHCSRVDAVNQRDYEETLATQAALSPLLGEDDAEIRVGMGMITPPNRVDRRWPLVVGAAVTSFVLGSLISPPTAPDEASATAETSTPPMTVSSTTSSPPTTTRNADAEASSSRAAALSSSAAASSSALVESIRAEERAKLEQEIAESSRAAALSEAEQQNVPQGFVAPAPEPTRAPAPAAVPAPAQSASYGNCTAVWNAIGSPIYQGQPGYGSHLDRDGDGVGCEKDPR